MRGMAESLEKLNLTQKIVPLGWEELEDRLNFHWSSPTGMVYALDEIDFSGKLATSVFRARI